MSGSTLMSSALFTKNKLFYLLNSKRNYTKVIRKLLSPAALNKVFQRRQEVTMFNPENKFKFGHSVCISKEGILAPLITHNTH